MSSQSQTHTPHDSDSEEIGITRRKPKHEEDQPAEPAPPSDASVGGTPPPEKTPKPKRVRTSQTIKKPSASKPKLKEDADKYAFNLINEMKTLYKADFESLARGEAATTKLDNVESIYNKFVRKETQAACIRLGGLNEIRLWLEPLPDKSLPNQKLKKVLLELLYILRIRKADLLNSNVGKIVHFYCKNSHEAKDVRKLAGNVMRKWMSVIIKEEVEE